MATNDLRALAFKAFGERKYDVALQMFLEIQKTEPQNLVISNNIAVCLKQMGEFVMAADILRLVLLQAPNATDPLRNLASCLLSQCKIEEAIEVCQKGLILHTTDPVAFSNLIYFISYAENITTAILHDTAGQFGTLFAYDQPWSKRSLWRQRRLPKDEPVEVAIISPDIRKHSVAYFLEPLLESYDHERFKITLCIDGPEPWDKVTAKLSSLVDTVLDIRRMKDKAIVREFNNRKIVIAIDLAGHSAHNRLPLFSRRLAPIQVSWLGYIGTTGIREMDYRLVDQWTNIPTEHSFEKQVWLPCGLHCYKPMYELPPLDLHEGPIKFCNFSNLGKVNRGSIRRWGKILAQVPDSTLWLKAYGFQSAGVRALWEKIIEDCGVPMSRVKLDNPTKDHRTYLEEVSQADIWLDTQPYASATTACEALWSGVPVISMAGRTAASNLSRSISVNAGYPEFAYETEEGFIWKAVQLARDRKELNTYRATCRERLAKSPLFDKRLFASEVMATFDRMVEHEDALHNRKTGEKNPGRESPAEDAK